MDDYLDRFPETGRHAYRIIAFDWIGTAVKDCGSDARSLAGVLAELLAFGVLVVVIAETGFDHIDRQFCSLIQGRLRKWLYVCANLGSEVYGFDERLQPLLLYGRKASREENRMLDRAVEAVKADITGESDVSIDIVYRLLNRRKIDLIPEVKDPPRSLRKLRKDIEKRLREGGFEGGPGEAFELAERHARELGLTDARITSDVKHIGLGLTDKSDSMRWIIGELARKRNIPLTDLLVMGDEFGPLGGFEGSDYRMVQAGESGITYLSVGEEPHGVPPQVIRIGGGPDRFKQVMKKQVLAQERLHPYRDEAFLLVETGWDHRREREIESQFAVGNGYLETRASLEEQGRECSPATLAAGVYDRNDAESIEELPVLPDWLFTRVFSDGQQLKLSGSRAVEQRRILDMKKGVYFREWRHRKTDGATISLTYLHFVSLKDPHALVARLRLFPEDHEEGMRVETGLELCLECMPPLRILSENNGGGKGPAVMEVKTTFTGIVIAVAQKTLLEGGFLDVSRSSMSGRSGVIDVCMWNPGRGEEVTLDKFVSLYTSRDNGGAPAVRAQAHVAEIAGRSLEELLREHVDAWEERWRRAAVVIKGDVESQRWANFAAYHLISAGNPDDETVSIGARALTGPVYKGHIFWDSEVFILPFFIYTHPPMAKAMLMYRYHTLPAAREKAREMGYAGALYAWESATTGEEMTPSIAAGPTGEVIPILSGRLEQHISAGIAFAVWSYWNATRDTDFLLSAGAEILIETARFWVSRCEKKKGAFHILEVEGPDEYHEGVDDNAYTNMMAAFNLRKAVEVTSYLREALAQEYAELCTKTAFTEGEAETFSEVAGRMYTGRREDGVIEQFDGFFSLDDIDVRDYRHSTAPLDVILGRDKTASTRVVKQADVVMLIYLLEDEFDRDTLIKNFDYYDIRTSHGSSLSPSIYGLVAARLGMRRKALRYFRQAGSIDLADNMGNAAGGVHAAALGGLWQQIVMGFAGVRAGEEGIALYPMLPSRWSRLSFSLSWRGCVLGIDIRRNRRISLNIEGERNIYVGIYGRPLQELAAGSEYVSSWHENSWGDFA